MKVNELQLHDSTWINLKSMLCKKKKKKKKERKANLRKKIYRMITFILKIGKTKQNIV